jgi:ABC-type microcin C transport system permease subunit YejE
MKTKFIASTLIALAALATTSAFAAVTYESEAEAAALAAPFASKVSRDDVRAETALWNKTNYSANLESIATKDVEPQAPSFASTLSRDDVRTQTSLWNKANYSANLESVGVSIPE